MRARLARFSSLPDHLRRFDRAEINEPEQTARVTASERQSARNAAEIRGIRSAAAEKHGERCREEKTHGRGRSVGRSVG